LDRITHDAREKKGHKGVRRIDVGEKDVGCLGGYISTFHDTDLRCILLATKGKVNRYFFPLSRIFRRIKDFYRRSSRSSWIPPRTIKLATRLAAAKPFEILATLARARGFRMHENLFTVIYLLTGKLTYLPISSCQHSREAEV
jgi:hypothetical protein